MSCSTSTNSKTLPLVVNCTIIQYSLSYGKLRHYFRSRTRPFSTARRAVSCGRHSGSVQDSRGGQKSNVRLIRGEIRTDKKAGPGLFDDHEGSEIFLAGI